MKSNRHYLHIKKEWGNLTAFMKSPFLSFLGGIFTYLSVCSFGNIKSLYFTTDNAHSRVWPKLSGKKIFCFRFLIQLFTYLYLETKLIIIFQGIILHLDIVTAF